jgi:hypothetical protein
MDVAAELLEALEPERVSARIDLPEPLPAGFVDVFRGFARDLPELELPDLVSASLELGS